MLCIYLYILPLKKNSTSKIPSLLDFTATIPSDISSNRAPTPFTMASPPPVIFILGAGPRVGSSVARKFAAQGFSVAIASRSVTDGSISTEGYLQLCVDLSQPASVPAAFETIKARLGAPPNVVVYNGRPPASLQSPLNSSNSTHPFQAPSASPTRPPTPSPSPWTPSEPPTPSASKASTSPRRRR